MGLPPSAALLLVSLAAVFSIVTQRNVRGEMRCVTILKTAARDKYIRWKGLGTWIGQIRHFVFVAGRIAIVPFTSARLYSIDYLHWGDVAELKEVTVSINRFVSSILCENWMFPEVTPWPNASIFQSERGGSNSVSVITITGHCFPLNQNNIFFFDRD